MRLGFGCRVQGLGFGASVPVLGLSLLASQGVGRFIAKRGVVHVGTRASCPNPKPLNPKHNKPLTTC